MIAVFLSGANVIGYKPLDYEGEEETFQLPYRLYASLPSELVTVPEGYAPKFDPDTESFYHEELPLPPEPEPDRIAQLENESAMLALELVDTQIRLDQAETEQAALLLELIDKGVL